MGRLDALGALAHAQVLLGDLAEAGATLEAAGQIDRDSDAHTAGLDIAQAWLLAARGEPDSARDRLVETAERGRGLGRLAVSLRAWHDLVRLGAPDRARDPLDELAGATGGAVDGLWPDLYLAHAEALLRDEPGDLGDCANRFAAAGAMLEAAEVAAESADAYRRQGRSPRAVVAGERAHALLARCEGARLTGPLHAGMVAALTGREREIATLAAAGHTNRDIAARLYLSVRTVENHLYRVYAKLGITGRDLLADRLSTLDGLVG